MNNDANDSDKPLVVLSHQLYKPGMDILDGKVDILITNNGDSGAIIDDLKNADGFILRIGRIDRFAIEQCPKLKVITRPGVGIDNVDVASATQKGIPVVICPAANSHAVAEHTLALMFACAKNLVESDQETRKGNFAIRNKYAAVELASRTVAIIGFGNIGKEVARLCLAFGMKAIACDPFITAGQAAASGCSYASDPLEAIRDADFVSLHMPSLPTTRDMVDHNFLAAMQHTAFLINCARGDLVDEQALAVALKNQTIAGAAVDVLKTEPMDRTSPLMGLSNCIITPHMAAQTKETTTKIVTMAVEGTLAVLAGRRWPHVCNPEVYQHHQWKGK